MGKVIKSLGKRIVLGYSSDRAVVYVKIRVEYADGTTGWIYRDEPNVEYVQ